ncbi:MAG TPA: hypothetical protein VFW99_01580 [Candidatus Nitrosotalea sp.]|nr:hypothetical protein [Candidatus Nitrosotalea sp.]
MSDKYDPCTSSNLNTMQGQAFLPETAFVVVILFSVTDLDRTGGVVTTDLVLALTLPFPGEIANAGCITDNIRSNVKIENTSKDLLYILP